MKTCFEDLKNIEVLYDLFDSTDSQQVCTVRASSQENLTLLHANNKGADQPTHLRSLVSAFVVRFLERIIAKLVTCKISIF